MQWVYILTPSGLLADADDQESFDLGLPFFELMTFNIFIVYTIDSYVEQTYLYKELRFGVQSKGKKKVTSTSLSVYCTIFLYLTHNKIWIWKLQYLIRQDLIQSKFINSKLILA